MNIIYTLEEPKNNIGDSIFLAGPTHRIKDKASVPKSWRIKAIEYLRKNNFSGTVFFPEWKDNTKPNGWSYSSQVDWEKKYLKASSAIVFWIPRDLDVLPAFTTNIEFGEYLNSGKIFIGAPETAEKNEYLKERCLKRNIKWHDELKDLISNVCEKFNKKSNIFFTSDTHFGAERTLELSRRPFINVEEMDNTLISNWNSLITKNDTVLHLGDFGNPETLKFLSGKEIYIIAGNYETDVVRKELLKDPRVKILEKYIMKFKDKKIGLIHEPLKKLNDVDFYLFGHIHTLAKVKRNGLNVGVDCHNFQPIDLKVVEFYMNAIDNFYDENVFLEKI